jgi:hypothetical protein
VLGGLNGQRHSREVVVLGDGAVVEVSIVEPTARRCVTAVLQRVGLPVRRLGAQLKGFSSAGRLPLAWVSATATKLPGTTLGVPTRSVCVALSVCTDCDRTSRPDARLDSRARDPGLLQARLYRMAT